MSGRIVVRAGLLIDGNGNAWKNRSVVVKSRSIEGVVESEDCHVLPGDEVIDASAYTVMPGLIDCHVHTRSSGDPKDRGFDSTQTSIPTFAYRALLNAHKDLEAGFTTIRDMASIGYVDISLRDTFERGDFPGPRMRVVGYGLTQWGGHMHHFLRPGLDMVESTGVVNNPAEAQSAARYQIGRGADGIKFNSGVGKLVDGKIVMEQEMDYDLMAVAVKEARKVGAWSATHCHGGRGATDAILAGVTSIEHGHWLTDEHFDLMLRNGTIFVPTMCPNEKRYERGKDRTGSGPEFWEWLERETEDKIDTLARAMKAGVPIAAGSDAGTNYNFHGENAREMEFLVMRGMPPMMAIVAGTKIAAMTAKLDHKIGTLDAGKWADVIVVNGNPVENIKVLNDKANILLIMKDGKVTIERGPSLRSVVPAEATAAAASAGSGTGWGAAEGGRV